MFLYGEKNVYAHFKTEEQAAESADFKDKKGSCIMQAEINNAAIHTTSKN
jgi:hypothetical protein